MFKLFLLYAILIFAKRAPKLITDLLNIKGDNLGLKGLSIKNKMGEAALVGDKVKKGMMGVEGGIKRAAGAGSQKLKKGLGNKAKKLKDKLIDSGKDKLRGTKVGDIGKEAKKGWKNGGDNLKDRVVGALTEGGRKAKESLWDNRRENWNNLKKNAADKGQKLGQALNPIPKVKGLREALKNLKPADIKNGAKKKLNDFKGSIKIAGDKAKDMTKKSFKLAGEGIIKAKDGAVRALTSEDAQNLYGNFMQGFADYANKENTTGAYATGASTVTQGYKPAGQKIEDKIFNFLKTQASNLGIEDEKTAKNIYENSRFNIDSKEKLTATVLYKHYNIPENDAGIKKFKASSTFAGFNEEQKNLFDKVITSQKIEDLSKYLSLEEERDRLNKALKDADYFNEEAKKRNSIITDLVNRFNNKYENSYKADKDLSKLLSNLETELNTSNYDSKGEARKLLEALSNIGENPSSDLVEQTFKKVINGIQETMSKPEDKNKIMKRITAIATEQDVIKTQYDIKGNFKYELDKTKEDLAKAESKLSELKNK